MILEICKHDRTTNFVMGLAGLADGLIKVISCGFIYSQLTMKYIRYVTKKRYLKTLQG